MHNKLRIRILRSTLPVLAGFALLWQTASLYGAEENYYWKLGVGTYGTPKPNADDDIILTHARFDWQMIAFGSGVHMPTINRCLELNPRQRFLVRLWPRRGGDNFLKYLYTPGVKERIDRRLRDQVREVLDEISHPDQVIAFTFLEELPSRWHPFYHHKSDEDILKILQPYREAIEKDLGRPLVIDDETKTWLWEKFAESMDGVHSAIRAEAGDDRLILFWGRFDWFNVPMLQRIVNQGPADGVFIYVLKPGRWQEHVKVAEENGWPFFSQLSHNTGMKQTNWESCVELPHIKSRYNLGYFFYGGGNPLRPHRYDNPAVDRVNNVRRFSDQVHLRWFAANRNLGWDVFKRHIRFEPLVDFRPAGKGVNDIVDLYAVIPNPILEGHYPNEAGQKVSDVTASLKLPGWLKFETGEKVGVSEEVDASQRQTSKPGALAGFFRWITGKPVETTVHVGTVGPSRHRAPAPESFTVAHWRLRVTNPPQPDSTVTVSVKGTHSRLNTITGRTKVNAAEGHILPAFDAKDVMVSGQGWAEPGFGLESDTRPKIVMHTRSRPVPKPSLTDGEFTVDVSLGSYKNNAGYYRLLPQTPVGDDVNRIVYNGTVPPHSKLVITPDGKATLGNIRPLLNKQFRSEADPGPGSSSGYYKGAHAVNRPIPPGENVMIEISGKQKGKANSLILVYFRCAETGEKKGMSVLVNRFGEEWRNGIKTEIEPPFEKSILQSIALYRYPNGAEGTVWYGSLKADLSSPPEDADDVSDRIQGDLPVLRANRYTIITYFDEDTQQPEGSKIRVEFQPQTGLQQEP